MNLSRLFTAIVIVISFIGCARAEEMKMAVTTSFQNSGLADILLPEIKKDLGLDVRLVVVGTGQALRLGRSGDVDAVLVHARTAEEQFVADGFAPYRRDIMYNDFVLIGPSSDPAKVRDVKTAAEALEAIRKSKSFFASRGDNSGTHKKEISLWQTAGYDTTDFDALWYRAAGAGMGATLNLANGMDAYALADRASWLNFKNKGRLEILHEGDDALFNQYGFLPISKAKHGHVKEKSARMLESWLVSNAGKKHIREYKLAGKQLFTPNPKPLYVN
jgi:tungstate transport system substrate-binding protein